jgi:NAD(P)-dependent dehydrogenase (short-subunit alcohol dehydrogenase family)
MMKQTILVAGGTGNLGGRIVKALIARGAKVRTIVRNGSEPEKIAKLTKLGAKILRIASFQISPNEMDVLVAVGEEVKKTEFKLVPMGSMEDFSASNKRDRAAYPAGERELFPSWQAKQYLYSMFSVQNQPLDNDRYGFKHLISKKVVECL